MAGRWLPSADGFWSDFFADDSAAVLPFLPSVCRRGSSEALASHTKATPAAGWSCWHRCRCSSRHPSLSSSFRQLLVTIRTHQGVLAVWNAGATTETPNTTENVDTPASGGSITWTQLVKLFTQLWEMHGMTTVCETVRTRIIQDALGSIHFSTRTLLVGGYDEPNYRSCPPSRAALLHVGLV